MRGWMKVAFVISVALNLLVVGVLVGGLIARDRMGPPPPPGGDFGLGPLGAAFSEEDRREMRREAVRSGANLGSMRADLRADMTGLIAAVAQDPWNPDAVRAQLAGMHARAADRVAVGEQVMLDRLGRMSDAERHAYAERLRDRLPQGWRNAPPPAAN